MSNKIFPQVVLVDFALRLRNDVFLHKASSQCLMLLSIPIIRIIKIIKILADYNVMRTSANW